MWGVQVATIALAATAGAFLGWGSRMFLSRLRRGVVVRAGPMEVGAAVVAGVSVGIGWGRPTLALLLMSGLLLVVLSPVDLVHHRLPDAITRPALPVAAAAVGLTFLLSDESGSLLRAVVAAALLWLIFAVTATLSSAWMGRGDVKLIPTLGLLTGYGSGAAAVLAVVLAFVLGAAASVLGLAAGRLRLSSAIPLGPFLLLGGWLALLATPNL